MTWEELIEKLKDTNIDLTNKDKIFKINNYTDISKKKTQKEFEKIGITPDILFVHAIDALINNHIYNKIFKNVNLDFNTNPLEVIVYRKVFENITAIKKEFISLFPTENELIDFFNKEKYNH